MSKHTPGPWAVSDDGAVTLIIHAPKGDVDIARMSNDCEMFSEIRSNAPLIAAAPAMYEALRLLLGVDACHNKMIHCGECGYCKGMAALAQAEGK